MVTRVDQAIKEFMVTLMEQDGLDGEAFQQLLDCVRESFGLDIVYTLEKISVDREFTFRYMSVSKEEYNTKGQVLQLSPEAYEEAVHMYDSHHICGYNVEGAEKYAISNNVLHYGYVRCNNQVYDGSVGFQQFSPHIWSEEEKEALIKLGRVYGLVFSSELTSEINDNLFEALRAEEVMKYKAEHDALTGIINRRGFDKMACLLKEEHFPLALAMIDVDNFKEVNDTFGHEKGDKILVKIARLLNHTFRSSDIVSRLGGDEFAILLNNLTPEKREFIQKKIERINETLKNPMDGLPPTSLTVGVAFSPGGYKDELFQNADKALYEAKKQGKCRCGFFN